MTVLVWLGVGLVLGWLAGMLAGNRTGRLTYLMLGSVGALAAGFLFSLFGGLEITSNGVLTAMAGSSIVLVLYLGVSRRRT